MATEQVAVQFSQWKREALLKKKEKEKGSSTSIQVGGLRGQRDANGAR